MNSHKLSEEEEFFLHQYRQSYPGFQMSYPCIEWNKRHLPLLYQETGYEKGTIEYDWLQDLPRHKTTVIKSYVYDTTGSKPILKEIFCG